MLSTLSIIDESDEQKKTQDDNTTNPEQICDDDVANTVLDPVTATAPMELASNYEEAKKKQESASHSDLDSTHPPQLSCMFAKKKKSNKQHVMLIFLCFYSLQLLRKHSNEAAQSRKLVPVNRINRHQINKPQNRHGKKMFQCPVTQGSLCDTNVLTPNSKWIET